MSGAGQGVAVDQGTPGAAPVGPDGKPVNSTVYRHVFESDKAGSLALAYSAAQMGRQDVADHITATIGEPSIKLNVLQKNPFAAGVLIGVAAVGAGYGVYRGVKALRARRAAKAAIQPSNVIKMPTPPRAARA